MGTTTNAEIKLGELRARIEFETVIEAGTAALRPVKVQLVLVVPGSRVAGAQSILPSSMTVIGEIETVEA